jgi:Aldo/keto reductase family
MGGAAGTQLLDRIHIPRGQPHGPTLAGDHDSSYQLRLSPAVPVEDVAAVMAATPITVIHSKYSIMKRTFEKDVIPACEELGIGFVPFSPLASGSLSGKITTSDTYSSNDVRRSSLGSTGTTWSRTGRCLTCCMRSQTRSAQPRPGLAGWDLTGLVDGPRAADAGRRSLITAIADHAASSSTRTRLL